MCFVWLWRNSSHLGTSGSKKTFLFCYKTANQLKNYTVCARRTVVTVWHRVRLRRVCRRVDYAPTTHTAEMSVGNRFGFSVAKVAKHILKQEPLRFPRTSIQFQVSTNTKILVKLLLYFPIIFWNWNSVARDPHSKKRRKKI